MNRPIDRDWGELEATARRLVDDDAADWPEFVQALHRLALPRLRRNWLRLDPGERFELAEDAALNVFVEVLDRLRARQYATLRRFFAEKAQPISPDDADDGGPTRRGSFPAYLKVVLARATIDYQRGDRRYRRAARPAPPDGAATDDPRQEGTWHSFVSAHSRIPAARDPVTLWRTAQQLLDYLDAAHQTAVAHAENGGGNDRAAHIALAEKLSLYRDDEPDWGAARAVLQRGHDFRLAIELEISGCSQDEIGARLNLSRRVTQRVLEVAKQLLRARFAERARIA